MEVPVSATEHFALKSEILLKIEKENKRKKIFISEGMLESAQGSAWQGQSWRAEEVLVCPYQHGSAHREKEWRMEDRLGVSARRWSCPSVWCGSRLSRRLQAVMRFHPCCLQRQINILLTVDHCYGGNWAMLPSDSIIQPLKRCSNTPKDLTKAPRPPRYILDIRAWQL